MRLCFVVGVLDLLLCQLEAGDVAGVIRNVQVQDATPGSSSSSTSSSTARGTGSSRAPGRQNKTLRVETLSVDPPLFVIDELLDDSDCEALVNAALQLGLKPQPRHLGLRVDQAFFLQSPASGSLWDHWQNADANSDGHVDDEELQEFVHRRWHLKEFSIEEANKLIRETHELRMPVMSRRAFASYDWDSLLNNRQKESPEHFARYGSEVELRPRGPQELPAMRRLRTRVAHVLGWSEDDVLPGYGDPMKIVHYSPGGHRSCSLDSDEASAEDIGRRPVRAISVQVFLNDVPAGGNLLLPAAGPRGAFVEHKELERRCHEWCSGKAEHDGTDHSYKDGHLQNGILVKPKRGRAVLWHNHVVASGAPFSATVRRNESLNADCPVVSGEKWIASFPLLLRAPGHTTPTLADSPQAAAAKPEQAGRSSKRRDEF